MATLTINSIQANPVRVKFTFNGVTYLREYPNKQAALDELTGAVDENDLETAMKLVLRKWAQTDPNFNNIAQLVGKTATITVNVSIV